MATANITVNEGISSEHTEGAANVRPHIKFNDDEDDNTGEDDIKEATTNIAVNEVFYSERAEGARDVRPRPPSLCAYDSSRAFNTTTTTVSSEGGRIESNMSMLMLSMQIQQTAQQILIQQQIFMQQMQVHMSVMENRVDTSKKYLSRIVKSMTTQNNNKRKRSETDEEHDDSSNDDK